MSIWIKSCQMNDVKSLLKATTLMDSLMLFGNPFHSTAADVSMSRFPYLTVLFRLGTSEVVEAERRARLG